MQVAVDDRRAEAFGERLAFLDCASPITTPPPARITGNFALREQLGRFVEALLAAGAAIERARLRDLAFDLAVEVVARDVELRRAHLEHRAVEAARR